MGPDQPEKVVDPIRRPGTVNGRVRRTVRDQADEREDDQKEKDYADDFLSHHPITNCGTGALQRLVTRRRVGDSGPNLLLEPTGPVHRLSSHIS
jgi:hypothetical protein